MKKITTIITSIVFVVMSVGMASAMNGDFPGGVPGGQPGFNKMGNPPRGGERPERPPFEAMRKQQDPDDMLAMAMEQLNLDPSQKTRIARLFKADRDAAKSERQAMDAGRDAMSQAQFEGNVDAVRSLSKKIAQKKQDKDMRRAITMNKVRKILTPEQAAKLDALHRKFAELRKGHRPHKPVSMDSWILENI